MSFEFTTSVDVRYNDIDSYGHVNNALYGTYIEEARINYLETVVGGEAADVTGSGEETGMVVANLELDFERPIRLVDDVTVGVRVPRLGESGFPFEYEIRTEDGVAATGETTVVAYDRESASPRPIPDHWRETISEFEGL
jgi:acyl-CoA thioester hydrolase